MRPTHGLFVPGPAGRIEAHLAEGDAARASIVLCHPHPQYGGSMHDGVLATIAQIAEQRSIVPLRFNFRGVGDSAGSYDRGVGEVDDLLAVLDWLHREHHPGKLLLGGYSFGSHVVWQALDRAGALEHVLLVAPPVGAMNYPIRDGLEMPVDVIYGDADAFVAKLADAVREASPGTMLTADILDAFERNRERLTSVKGVARLAAGAAPKEDAKTQAVPSVAMTDAKSFLSHPELATEAFGPFTLVIAADGFDELVTCANAIEGQLTATIHGTDSDLAEAGALITAIERFAGRVIVNGYPTGVEVCPSMNHGGPYPATTDVRFTSVGTAAMLRFARPVCYQGFADTLLPVELRNGNPRGILRTVNGELTRDAV